MTKTVRLSNLLSNVYQVADDMDRDITGLALDSRSVKPGDLFFACKGTYLDGRRYIADAIAKGAQAILAEAELDKTSSHVQSGVPIIFLQNLNHEVSHIAAKFFDNPAKNLRVVGVTGTNGKTSCSHFVAAALEEMNIPCGVIGTLGKGMYGAVKPGTLTTPDAITLQTIFTEFVELGAKAVSMEVSSHSLDQGRVDGIIFEVGIFTNLTRDHLDYHGTMEAYGAAKRLLFDNPFLRYAVINADDEFGQSLIKSLHTTKDIVAYTLQKPVNPLVPTLFADKIELDITGLKAQVHSPWGEGQLHVPLVGLFNLSNVLAVLVTLCLMKVPFKDALKALSHLKPVPGRMEKLGGYGQPLVVVDYSHTPDALEKALLALREHCEGQLYCVFGCGGDRDRGKRPIMAKVAEQFADKVVVTDDNPRHEVPEEIVKDIMRGFKDVSKVTVEHDRSKAIQDVIRSAKAGDCILVAGKGAETYQQFGDEKVPFSDIEKVTKFLIPTT